MKKILFLAAFAVALVGCGHQKNVSKTHKTSAVVETLPENINFSTSFRAFWDDFHKDTKGAKTLENYVKNGKIKVVLSDIVVRESKRHIADQIKKICGIMRKARAAALEESTEHLISTIGLGEILRIVTNKGELISKGEEMFDDFLRTINTEILGADLIDVGLVLGDYFETKPPFENSEKKKVSFQMHLLLNRSGNDWAKQKKL